MAKIQLKRSVILDGGNAKEPTASQMQYGEIAINYNEDDPSIFIKDSSDAIVRIAGVNARGNIPSDIQGYPDITDSQGATLDARYLKLGSGIGAQVVQSSSPTDFNGGLKVSGGSTYLLELASGGATKLVVLPTGQVGIGVTSPTAPLQVSGQVVASSFAGTGSALTSLDGGNISQGTINTARLPATYTLDEQITIEATGSLGYLTLRADKNIGLTASESSSFIRFRGNNGQGSYRFTKAGQSTIEGFLDFESLTTDRTFTYPDVSGTVALISSTIDNSDKLDGLHAASFIRSDAFTEVTSNTEWQDSKKAMFGNDEDLQIYHDGTKALIVNNTGNLLIRSNVDDDDGGNIVLQAKSGEDSIVCNDDGSVKLFYNALNKIETNVDGATTTGIHKSNQFKSTIANGTSPLIVASSTLVANLNADALDGVHAASFLRSDVNTTFNANLANFSFNSDGDRVLISFQYNAASQWQLKQNNNGLDLDFDKVGTHSGSMRIDGNLIWHAGNDGAGSGLDADTLDGNDSSNFIRSNVASNITNTMEFQDNVELQFGNSSDFRIFHNSSSNNNIIQNYRNSDGNILINGANTAGTTQTMLVADSSTARTFVQLNENDAIRLKTTDIGATVYGSLKTTASQGTAPLIVTSSTVVTNLNADQLDGLHAGSFVRGDNQISGSGAVTIRADDVDFVVSDTTEATGEKFFIMRDHSAQKLYVGVPNAVLTPRSDVLPYTDGAYNLGSNTERWLHCYVDDLTITNGLDGSDITTGTISEDRLPSSIEKQAHIEIKANGANHDLKLYASDHVIINAGLDETASLYFRANSGTTSYRFAKSGQTSIEGNLSFESLTADRTFTFPDETGTVMLTTFPVDNANKLDNLDSTQFLRSDVSTTYNASGNNIEFLSDGDRVLVDFKGSTGSKWILRQNNSSIDLDFQRNVNNTAGNILIDGNKVWHAGNDGIGSGLNADKLHGLSAGQFIRADANDAFSGDIVSSVRSGGIFGTYDSLKTDHVWSMGTAYKNASDGSDFGNLYGIAYKHTNNTTGGTMGGGHQMVWVKNGDPCGAIGQDCVYHTTAMKVGSNTVYHQGNDGSGSGLDADKLDGVQGSSFLRSDTNDTATGAITFNGPVLIRGHLDISDSQQVRFGSSDDITILYNPNNWLYLNFVTGAGIIFQDNGPATMRLEDSGIFRPENTGTGSIGTSDKYWANGYFSTLAVSNTLTVRGAIDLADNDVLRFGSGDDAQMVHNGSHFYLKLLADDDFIITDENSSSLPAFRFDTSARRLYVQDNILAGYNLSEYNNAVSNGITTYARDGAYQATNTWTSYASITGDYRGSMNEVANESTHHFISEIKDRAGNRAVVNKLDVNGSHWGLGSIYSGRTQSSTTSTATNYYARTGSGYGIHGYNGAPIASGKRYATTYRAYVKLTAVFDDADDRKSLYGIKSDTDSTLDFDQDHYLACSAMGRFDVKGGIRSGRVESDEASPNSIYAPVGWGGGIAINSYVANANSYTFISGRTTANSDPVFRARVNQAADKVRIQANGQAYTDGAWNNSPADYAEYFEWEDGNVTDEDRRGVTVVLLQDGKIRAATEEDDSESIIGVISAYPAFVGDAAELSWHGMYEKDSFGKPVEEYELWLIWNKDYKDGVPINQPIASDPNSWGACEGFPLSDLPRIEKLMADGIQTGIPRWAIDQNCVVNKPKQIVSSAYDPSKVYIPRSERKEWDTVGLIGKLPVVKGSPIGSRWIKMGELTDTLDRYFVR